MINHFVGSWQSKFQARAALMAKHRQPRSRPSDIGVSMDSPQATTTPRTDKDTRAKWRDWPPPMEPLGAVAGDVESLGKPPPVPSPPPESKPGISKPTDIFIKDIEMIIAEIKTSGLKQASSALGNMSGVARDAIQSTGQSVKKALPQTVSLSQAADTSEVHGEVSIEPSQSVDLHKEVVAHKIAKDVQRGVSAEDSKQEDVESAELMTSTPVAKQTSSFLEINESEPHTVEHSLTSSSEYTSKEKTFRDTSVIGDKVDQLAAVPEVFHEQIIISETTDTSVDFTSDIDKDEEIREAAVTVAQRATKDSEDSIQSEHTPEVEEAILIEESLVTRSFRKSPEALAVIQTNGPVELPVTVHTPAESSKRLSQTHLRHFIDILEREDRAEISGPMMEFYMEQKPVHEPAVASTSNSESPGRLGLLTTYTVAALVHTDRASEPTTPLGKITPSHLSLSFY